MWAGLCNKVILVTGAGGGFGSALVKKLAKSEANVIAVARKEEQLQKLCEVDEEHVRPLQLDLSDWNAVRQELAQLPQLDGVVNNAGVAIIKPFEELTEKDINTIFEVNFKAVVNITQSLLRYGKLRESASIVNVSSLASSRSFNGHAAYGASKAALDSLTKSLALELAPQQIRVNSVNPTVVMTPMGIKIWSDPAKSKPLLKRIPLSRFGEVDEVVETIGYLLSESSSFVNGHHLMLEGGYSVS
ncbi:L-xylulose reductase-like [Drosophila sulfurigaster albostrigata]|uniref:L-xylulose reductase-like n=1 Tax=Drosophila sulfurigaster albostrigata TaxID=89887 RepID=UPI002D21B719|nr:L-xylulose reductase-like [Drosophila sulfurigaster albostrigata]